MAAAQELPGPVWVVKAQIHAGGRGKGGGVKVVRSIEDVRKEAQRMMGMTLVTHQTGPHGRIVRRLYIEDGSAIERELYLSALVDRATSRIAFIVSTEGGMDIEEVAHKTPEKIHTFQVEPAAGYSPYVGNEIAVALGLKGDQAKQIGAVVKALYEAFLAKDMSLLEINPLWSPRTARSSASMPSSISTTIRCGATRTSRSCATWTRKTPPKSKRRNTTCPISSWTARSAAWSRRGPSPWRRWTSSSCMAASLPTSWMSAAARPRKKSPKPSRSSSAIPM